MGVVLKLLPFASMPRLPASQSKSAVHLWLTWSQGFPTSPAVHSLKLGDSREEHTPSLLKWVWSKQATEEGEWWCVHLADRKTKAAGFMGNSSGRAGVEALAEPRPGKLTLMRLSERHFSLLL